MSRTIRYLTHPQVNIDPEIPVPSWSLSEIGRTRIDRLAASGVLRGTRHIISSAETKAIQTAAPLAEALGLAVEIRPDMHENDRSATGFLPPDEFEATADLFFANPSRSIRGWEPAIDAQTRIVAEVRACLEKHPVGDILFVGHGGVGTLLYCHLAGHPISRAFDQGEGGGGCVFDFSGPDSRPLTHWRPLETLFST